MFEFFHKGIFVVVICGIIATPFVILMQAENQAKVINEQYGKHYTATDMLLSGDVIRQNIVGEKRTQDINLK